jgi:hypothetical protein
LIDRDKKAGSFFAQRFRIAIQCGNAVTLKASEPFAHVTGHRRGGILRHLNYVSIFIIFLNSYVHVSHCLHNLNFLIIILTLSK